MNETNRKRWFAAAAIVGHSTLPTCGDRQAFEVEVLLNTSPAKEIRIRCPLATIVAIRATDCHSAH